MSLAPAVRHLGVTAALLALASTMQAQPVACIVPEGASMEIEGAAAVRLSGGDSVAVLGRIESRMQYRVRHLRTAREGALFYRLTQPCRTQPTAPPVASLSPAERAAVERLNAQPVVLKAIALGRDLRVVASVESQSDKTVRYVRLFVTPFNAVGDVPRLASGARGSAQRELEITGPIEPGASTLAEWRPAWFSETITCLRVDRIAVVYMDRTTRVISRPADAMYGSNDCSYEGQRGR